MNEGYPSDWKRLILMVSPNGEYHAVGGDREPGEGDREYIGLERMKHHLQTSLTGKGGKGDKPMEFRDQMLYDALKKIETLEQRLAFLERRIELDKTTDAINKTADELNAAVAGNPVPRQ